MNRSTLIRGLKRALLGRVPPEQRAEAGVLLAALEDQYAALMSSVETAAYQEGVTAERQRHEKAEASGFDLGYQHGLQRALGSVGAPARRVDDDDLVAPAC